MTQAAIDKQYIDSQVTPYRTPEMDLKLWKQTNSQKYNLALALIDKQENPTGVNWNGSATTWEEFIERDDTVPVVTLMKDMRAQRPTDFESLLNMITRSNGVFDHAQASSIDVAYRPDGSKNVWDHWHTTMFAYVAGVSHVRISKLMHIQKTLEECRAEERNKFEGRNVFNLKTSLGQAHEFKVARIKTTDPEIAKYDPDVAIDNIFQKLNITTTGSKTSYTRIIAIAKIKESRRMWQKHLKDIDNSKADKQLENLLRMFTEVFPQEKIDGTLVEAVTFALINFSHVDYLQIPNLKKFFEAQKVLGNKTMSSYGKDALKVKHKSKEALALHIVYQWNDWVFNSNQKPKRPITVKAAHVAFADSFPKTFINSVWQSVTQTITSVCPNCSTTWEQKINQV